MKAGDPKRSGPSLVGIIGKKAGSEQGYAYSAAMKNSGIIWTAETLDAFMAAPNKVVPGNRMGFAGEPDAASRNAELAKAEKLLLDDVIFAPIAKEPLRRLVSPKVGGYVPSVTDYVNSQFLTLAP